MPQQPYPVSGVITDIDGSKAAATVQVYNLRTGDAKSMATNTQGEFSIDLADMPTAYANGDDIFVQAFAKAEQIFRFAGIRLQVNTVPGSTSQDLTLVAQNPPNPEYISESGVNSKEHEALANAKRVVHYGYTTGGEILPLLVVKDSTGQFGKLSAVMR